MKVTRELHFPKKQSICLWKHYFLNSEEKNPNKIES